MKVSRLALPELVEVEGWVGGLVGWWVGRWVGWLAKEWNSSRPALRTGLLAFAPLGLKMAN
ncbi:MAG: hypothetical protein ACPGWR_11535 [Ardenticatenaceae bacterium]